MTKQPKFDYSDIKFKDNGKLKLIIVVGTRPEIIRLAAVINKCRKYFDVILAHTGQNYDYNLNGIFFKDLKLAEPEVYMDAVGDDLGATCGNIINCSYKLFAQTKPDGVLVLGDTNSCLSVIGAKRLHIPIFHMEAGNRCKDECLPEETNRRIVDIISDVNMAYSEHARRYLADCGLPKERTFVTGSPMAEVLQNNLAEKPVMCISASGWRRANTSSFPLIEKRTSTPRRTSSHSSTPSTRWQRSTTCLFSTHVIHALAIVLQQVVSNSIHASSNTSL
mgnify:CR=1 FL=1